MRTWIHTLTHSHPILSKLSVGVIHLCVNRFTGEIKYAVWYPEGYREQVVVTDMDFTTFFTLQNVQEAFDFVREEGLW